MQLQLRLELAEGMPQAWLDYKQISYCLRTIILNIAASQQPGGVISVTSSVSDHTLHLCAIDSQHSLTAADSKLVTPFSETESVGEGLGLALCTVILERHGSSLTIDALEGGGTKYCIILQEKGVI
jgi:signal transduction histidine kinase